MWCPALAHKDRGGTPGPRVPVIDFSGWGRGHRHGAQARERIKSINLAHKKAGVKKGGHSPVSATPSGNPNGLGRGQPDLPTAPAISADSGISVVGHFEK